MGFGEAVRSVFSKYFQFSGRSRRSEYWYFVLFTLIVSIVLAIVDAAAFNSGPEDIGPLGGIFTLATVIPGLAVSVRRLHDINRTGWWIAPLYLLLIPMMFFFFSTPASVGSAGSGETLMLSAIFALAFLGFAMLLLVWACTNGTAGPNKYGPDPKQVEDAAQVFS